MFHEFGGKAQVSQTDVLSNSWVGYQRNVSSHLFFIYFTLQFAVIKLLHPSVKRQGHSRDHLNTLTLYSGNRTDEWS